MGMARYWCACLVWVVLVLIYAPPVLGQAPNARPVAIVEDVEGAEGLHPLQLIESGRRVDLREHGRIVLGFFGSCWQETIVGGQVVVESGQSRHSNAAVARRRVECDSSALGNWDQKSLGATSEAIPSAVDRADTPDLLLFGRSPLIMSLSRHARVKIERIDITEPIIEAELLDGTIDFSERATELEPGALYRFTSDNVSRIVLVDELAEAGRTPLLGRLVILPGQVRSGGRRDSSRIFGNSVER